MASVDDEESDELDESEDPDDPELPESEVLEDSDVPDDLASPFFESDAALHASHNQALRPEISDDRFDGSDHNSLRAELRIDVHSRKYQYVRPIGIDGVTFLAFAVRIENGIQQIHQSGGAQNLLERHAIVIGSAQ